MVACDVPKELNCITHIPLAKRFMNRYYKGDQALRELAEPARVPYHEE